MRCAKMSDRDVYQRFEDIVPRRRLEDMDIDEVENDCRIAFKIIGYTPKDFSASFATAWRQSVATMLFEFIFDICMEDKK